MLGDESATGNKLSPVESVKPFLCDVCGFKIHAGETYIGNGTGSGNRFCHQVCYLRNKSNEKDRRIAELEEIHKQDLINHERLERRNAELLAEVREWICEECRFVYPGPPSQGFDCVLCKKCSGYTMPKPQAKIRDLERQLSDVTDKLKEANETIDNYKISVEGYFHHQQKLEQQVRDLRGKND